MPAANCGNYGLRPTSHRVPLVGLAAPQMGSEQIWPVVGPQSTTLEGIKLFMKTVLAAKPWMNDPGLVPLPWRADENHLMKKGLRKLKVGVLWSDEVVKPQPSTLRALREVVGKLQGITGIEVVDWKPWKHDYAHEIIVCSCLLTTLTTVRPNEDATDWSAVEALPPGRRKRVRSSH